MKSPVTSSPDPRRWLILGTVGLAQLMVVLDATIVNIAAFGVYGAIVGAGGAIGLVLGGVLTEYLSWRWCLYVNLIFAGFAAVGALLLLKHQRARAGTRLDLPGVALVSASMFCLIYGFSNAANHNWHTPSPTASWRRAWPCSPCS